MKIYIEKTISSVLPDFNVLAMTMDVVEESSDIIDGLIVEVENEIEKKYKLEDVLTIPFIKEARDAYKALGKDPSRYRLACESLLRRIVKGNKLYRINNLVDAGNVLSIECKRSTAVLDLDKIVGDVSIRLGNESDIYEGIGRGIINVSNIPLYCDEVGPFGSPTSDTPRTMVTENTRKILLMIICFSNEKTEENICLAKDIFSKYANATNINEIEVIRK